MPATHSARVALITDLRTLHYVLADETATSRQSSADLLQIAPPLQGST